MRPTSRPYASCTSDSGSRCRSFGSRASRDLAFSCAACGLPFQGTRDFVDRFFMIMIQDFMDPWTFNQKNVMKCCKEILLPDGKQIPFCAYNSVGYREQARDQLAASQPDRDRARRTGEPLEIKPLRFEFDRPGTEA